MAALCCAALCCAVMCGLGWAGHAGRCPPSIFCLHRRSSGQLCGSSRASPIAQRSRSCAAGLSRSGAGRRTSRALGPSCKSTLGYRPTAAAAAAAWQQRPAARRCSCRTCAATLAWVRLAEALNSGLAGLCSRSVLPAGSDQQQRCRPGSLAHRPSSQAPPTWSACLAAPASRLCWTAPRPPASRSSKCTRSRWAG